MNVINFDRREWKNFNDCVEKLGGRGGGKSSVSKKLVDSTVYDKIELEEGEE